MCDFFSLRNFQFFFLFLSGHIYIIMLSLAYLIHGCYYHFWHFFAYAYMHIIMLSYHSSSFPTLILYYNSTVCMSLTLTVVQYERSTVRHQRLLIPVTSTVPANKYIHIYTQTTSTNEQQKYTMECI
jgi:hypothetical protein